jgi:diacylglycerol kinase (ATP)
MIRHTTLIKSFRFAFNGLLYALKGDQNFRIHIAAALLVIAASIFFDVNPFEMGILGVMIVLVMVTEMINTAIEHMVDLITKEHREDAKIAKDVSAGMVLLSSMGAIIVGFLIFTPHIFRLLGIRH